MLSGNLYGLVITLLTLVIAVVLTMRQVEETGIRFELVIQPVQKVVPGDQRKVEQEVDEEDKETVAAAKDPAAVIR